MLNPGFWRQNKSDETKYHSVSLSLSLSRYINYNDLSIYIYIFMNIYIYHGNLKHPIKYHSLQVASSKSPSSAPIRTIITGWWYTYPFWKIIVSWGWNHQPVTTNIWMIIGKLGWIWLIKSVGMMKFPILSKVIKFMFQTTNQIKS